MKLVNITLLTQWFLEPSDSWEDNVEEATTQETQSPEPAVEDKEEEVVEEKSGSKNMSLFLLVSWNSVCSYEVVLNFFEVVLPAQVNFLKISKMFKLLISGNVLYVGLKYCSHCYQMFKVLISGNVLYVGLKYCSHCSYRQINILKYCFKDMDVAPFLKIISSLLHFT